MRLSPRLLALLLGLSTGPAALGGCAPESREGGPGGGDGGGAGDAGARADADPSLPVDACVKLDLVFVIDDSDSMREEQTNLAASFPAFAEAIDGFRTARGGALDYRVAVTTTGVDLTASFMGLDIMVSEGPNGAFVPVAGLDRPWIERSDDDVAGHFAMAANVGVGGSTMEMPLRALELGLSARVADGANSGFLRDDALLGVVLLTDEDDCSYGTDRAGIFNDCAPSDPLLDPASVVAFLDDLKGGRDRWAAAVIAGPPPSSCESDFGAAQPATRLRAFTDAAGRQAVFSSICEGDLSASLADALATFDAACRAFPID